MSNTDTETEAEPGFDRSIPSSSGGSGVSALVGGESLDDLVKGGKPDLLAGIDQKKLLGDLTDVQRAKLAATEKVEGNVLRTLDADQARIKSKFDGIGPASDIKDWDADKERKERIKTPMENFGSNGAMFAVLASAFTKTPMNNALNGMAAAMTAAKDNDEKGYDAAYDAFKTNSNLAIKRHEMEREAYNDAISLMKTNLSAGEAAAKAVANRFGDKIALTYLENGMNKELIDAKAKQDQAYRSWTSSLPALYKMGDEREILRLDPRMQGDDPMQKRAALEDLRDGKLTPAQDIYRAKLRENPTATADDRLKFKNEIEAGEDDEATTNYKQAIKEFPASHDGREPNASERNALLKESITASKGEGRVKAEEAALEARAKVIQETEKPDGTFPTAWEARLQAAQEKKDATANALTRAKAASIKDADAQWLAEHPEANGVIPADVRNKHIADATKPGVTSTLSDAAATMLAQRLAAGDKSALAGLGYGSVSAANRAKVIEKATELFGEKGQDGRDWATQIAEYQGQTRGASALGMREANMTAAITRAQATAPRVLEISDKIDRTKFPSINSLILSARKGTGGEDVVRLGIAVETFINNYASALGAGSSVMTDSARDHARELLERGFSKGQMRAGVDQMMIELNSELAGTKRAMGEFLNKKTTPKATDDGWSFRRVN